MKNKHRKQILRLLRELKSNRGRIMSSGNIEYVELTDGTILNKKMGVCGYIVRHSRRSVSWAFVNWIVDTYGCGFPVRHPTKSADKAFQKSSCSKKWCHGCYADERWKFIDGAIERLELLST